MTDTTNPNAAAYADRLARIAGYLLADAARTRHLARVKPGEAWAAQERENTRRCASAYAKCEEQERQAIIAAVAELKY
jgi:hypothetical protein